ncbi:MAG: hypothetical protein SGCHY_005645, partial [Lobulomycetales sp.]
MSSMKLLLALTLPFVAYSCSCLPDNKAICETYEQKDTLFRGKVVAVQDALFRTYQINVMEVFKTPEDKPIAVGQTISITTGSNSGLCKVPLEIADEYLIDDASSIGLCGITRRFDSLQAEALQSLEWGGRCQAPPTATTYPTATVIDTSIPTGTGNGGYTGTGNGGNAGTAYGGNAGTGYGGNAGTAYGGNAGAGNGGNADKPYGGNAGTGNEGNAGTAYGGTASAPTSLPDPECPTDQTKGTGANDLAGTGTGNGPKDHENKVEGEEDKAPEAFSL